jgi:Fe-S cluster assembly protein SufB
VECLKESYKHGFTTDTTSLTFPKGLNRSIIEKISQKREEPDSLLRFRLHAYDMWKKMPSPSWIHASCDPIDLQNISYYAESQDHKENPAMKNTLNKLGISEKKDLALDFVFDSRSFYTFGKKQLEKSGIIFCSLAEAAKRYPELVKKYLGSVVPIEDNFYAALNSAVFSDGSFVYVPKNQKCPIPLSTYFRMNAKEAGQFERTLVIVDEGADLHYFEGCTAPAYSHHQLHAAVVEIVALQDAKVFYSTVQHWYPGDSQGKGGVYNFVTKRGKCLGKRAHISWTQIELGAAVTWKYPSCILEGEDSIGEFFSISLTTGKMQADTGTKMIHLNKGTRSTIISRSISADASNNTFRSLTFLSPQATKARSYSQCDSLLMGNNCSAFTFPTLRNLCSQAALSHEATLSQLDENKLFYLLSRGFTKEEAIHFLIKGFCRDVLEKLPLEFSIEAAQLLSTKLKGSLC